MTGTTSSDNTEHLSALDWPWPEALDALTAAPEHHTLLFENAAVRVRDTRIRPGERTPVHTHRWPNVLYVLSWGAFVRRDAEEQVVFDSRRSPAASRPGGALWSTPLPPHSLENVGGTEIRVISVELKHVAA